MAIVTAGVVCRRESLAIQLAMTKVALQLWCTENMVIYLCLL